MKLLENYLQFALKKYQLHRFKLNSNIEFFYKKRKLARSSIPGGHSSSIKGAGMIFDRLVSLVENPDPRRLDIRASLKDPFEQWRVREFRQKAAIPVTAIIDLSASMSFHGEVKNILFLKDFLNSLQRSTHIMGDRMGLIGFDKVVKKEWLFQVSQKRILDERKIIELFKNLKLVKGHSGIKKLHSWLPREPGLVFFLSDFHFSLNLFDDFLTNTNRHEVIPIIIQDEAEVNGWPLRGLCVLSDSESGKKRLVWIGEEWRAKLKESYEKRNTKIREICNKHGISPLFMNSRFEPKNVSSYFLTGR
jgi:hypothetical protein